MSDFSDNASKYLADGYLRFWPSGELAPVRCYEESSSHARKQGVGAVFGCGRPLWEGPLEKSPE